MIYCVCIHKSLAFAISSRRNVEYADCMKCKRKTTLTIQRTPAEVRPYATEAPLTAYVRWTDVTLEDLKERDVWYSSNAYFPDNPVSKCRHEF